MSDTPVVFLLLPKPGEAAAWLRENLFFSSAAGIPIDGASGSGTDSPETEGALLQNGNCLLRLMGGAPGTAEVPAAGCYHTGLAHIALNTPDIAAAEAHCRRRGLDLSDVGSFNPKVYGGGEYYFNIRTPFGVTFEVSQKAGETAACQNTSCQEENAAARASGDTSAERPPIYGLDHLGIPAADFTQEVAFFRSLGFAPAFAPVENRNEKEGRIACVMLEKGGFALEVYQFVDLVPQPLPNPCALHGIAGLGGGTSPGGVRLLAGITP